MHTPTAQHPNNTVASQVAAALGPDEQAFDEARQTANNWSMASLICGCLELCFFWAAFGWTIVPTGFAIFVGAIGRQHLSSLTQLRTNSCMCGPLSFLSNLKWVSLSNGIMSIFGIISSIAAAIRYSGESTVMVFAVLSTFTMFGISVTQFHLYQDYTKLLACAALDPVFIVAVGVMNTAAQPGYPAQQGQPQPQQAQVVMVQQQPPPPMYTSQGPQYGNQPPPPPQYNPQYGQQPPQQAPPPDIYGSHPPPQQQQPVGYGMPAPAPQLHQPSSTKTV